MRFSSHFNSNRQKKIHSNIFLSDVAMIAYMTHVFGQLISSPSAIHLFLIVVNRFIQPFVTLPLAFTRVVFEGGRRFMCHFDVIASEVSG